MSYRELTVSTRSTRCANASSFKARNVPPSSTESEMTFVAPSPAMRTPSFLIILSTTFNLCALCKSYCRHLLIPLKPIPPLVQTKKAKTAPWLRCDQTHHTFPISRKAVFQSQLPCRFRRSSGLYGSTCIEAGDTDHCAVYRICFSRNQHLQSLHNCGSCDDWIDAEVGHCSMASFPIHSDPEASGARHNWADLQ